MKCRSCNCDFPPNLMVTMTSGVNHQNKCPLCSLEFKNRMAGLRPGTPFSGKYALGKYNIAKTHLRTTKQTRRSP